MLGIWQYTQSRWSEQQADKYTNALFEAMQTLAEEPSRGRTCDEIHPGLRRFSRGSHIIFYLTVETGADIVRVLHQRMDHAAHLANDES